MAWGTFFDSHRPSKYGVIAGTFGLFVGGGCSYLFANSISSICYKVSKDLAENCDPDIIIPTLTAMIQPFSNRNGTTITLTNIEAEIPEEIMKLIESSPDKIQTFCYDISFKVGMCFTVFTVLSVVSAAVAIGVCKDLQSSIDEKQNVYQLI